MKPRRILFAAGLLAAMAGCSPQVIDNGADWCERLAAADITKEDPAAQSPFGGIRIDSESLRDHVAEVLNRSYRNETGRENDRFVWREGAVLHMVNIAPYTDISPADFLGQWREGIGEFWDSPQAGPRVCTFGLVAGVFDELIVHSGLESSAIDAAIATERLDRAFAPI